MAGFKNTMIFALTTGGTVAPQRVGGWTESWYTSGVDPLQSQFLNLCQFRAALLPSSAAIVGQRYQRVDPVGQSVTGSTTYPGGIGLDTDVPQMGLLISCRSNLLNIRKFILRGIPDGQVTFGAFTPSTFYRGLLLDFFDRLTAASWQFQGRDKTFQRFKLASVSTVAGITKLTTVDAANWLVGQTLAISGARLTSGLTVSKKVIVGTVADPFTYEIQGWGLDDTMGGSAVRYSLVFPVVTAVDVSRATVRKVGRPSNGYRGRRSKVRAVK